MTVTTSTERPVRLPHVDGASLGSRIVVFAPHVDDEVIGCWRFLKRGQVREVVYFNDLTPERVHEARACEDRFGFKARFYDKDKPLRLDSDMVILVPNIKDNHPHHKEVNQFARAEFPTHKKFFYSVDMNTGRNDILEDSTKKLECLKSLFLSQAGLFDNDQKYHLFESLSARDLATTITVTTQFEGIHAYPEAPEGVEFLRYPHRHVFHVRVELEVFHDDREVEFILFKREISAFISDNFNDLQSKSCEMLGELFINYVTGKYKGRSCSVSVFEDGENGATVKFNYI